MSEHTPGPWDAVRDPDHFRSLSNDDKVQASYQRMRNDLIDRWEIAAQQDPDFLFNLVIRAVIDLSDKQVAQLWRKVNKMEKRNE